MATANDVAKWMVEQLKQQGMLYQEQIVYDIQAEFGEEFTYYNNNGNPAINKDVLDAFKKLTPDVVWIRGERYWRTREPGDEPGRNQSYGY